MTASNRRASKAVLAVAAILFAGACVQPLSPKASATVDAGPIDSGEVAVPDSGPVDAGPVDAGPMDAGPEDAGPIDAGCPLGLSPCADGCDDLSKTAADCGQCGKDCATGDTCSDSVCCLYPQIGCNGECVNTLTNSDNCGGCGKGCSGGEQCSMGMCCTSNEINCGGNCVDPTTDPNNCGGCNVRCGGEDGGAGSCVASVCTCTSDNECPTQTQICSQGGPSPLYSGPSGICLMCLGDSAWCNNDSDCCAGYGCKACIAAFTTQPCCYAL